MFSPYFLRLPQIEMLVSVQYGMPREVCPITYSDTRESVLFSVELGHDPDPDPDSDAAPPTARALTYPSIATHLSSGRTTPTASPDTIEELVLLVGTAPMSEGALMMKVQTDPEGGEALQRSLDRDPVAIPGAISSGGHVPRPTDCEEKLVNADDADAAHRDKFANGIQELRTYVKETEEQLRRDEVDIRMTGNVEQGSTEYLKP
ncbi:hypothetical protein B0H14DRAFT_3725191 [Mycena olivaceomarginata]|nr:hypothetical protein B0H14DRAFT_3725191 [Mycena olivaceomarginata]